MKKDHLVWIALLSLFAFHAISNMAIIFKDTTPFLGDATVYYKLSVRYWRAWIDFSNGVALSSLFPVVNEGLGGQLLALLAVPFFFVFGVSHDVAILASQPFFLILILSIFGLGKILFDRKTGLLAAFLISFYPGVVGFSRVFMLGFSILAISTACVYLLIKSEGFKKFKYSLCFGFAFALGELLRPRFALYIVVPFLFYMIKHIAVFFRRTEAPAPISAAKMAINIIASAALSCLLLSPWYSMDRISGYLEWQNSWFSMPALSNIIPTSSYYLQMLFKVNLGWFFTPLFFLGLVISLFEKNKRPKIYFLLTWFVLTLVLVSMFGLKNYSRLSIPLLAPIALISCAGLERLFKPKIGKLLAIALVFCCMIQYFFVSYANQFIDEEDERRRLAEASLSRGSSQDGSIDWALPVRKRLMHISLSRGLLRARRYDWKLDELMRTFEERRNTDETWAWKFIHNIVALRGNAPVQGKGFIRILDIDCNGTPINNGMVERILMEELPIVVMGLYSGDFNFKKMFSEEDLQHIVLGADYVMRHNVEWPEGGFIDQVLAVFDANITRFEKLKTIMTPWGDISIYGRKKNENGI